MVFRHIFSHWTYETFPPGAILRAKHNAFKLLMEMDETCLRSIADLEAIHADCMQADWTRVHQLGTDLDTQIRTMLEQLQHINPLRFMDIMDYLPKISFYMRMALSVADPDITPPFVFPIASACDHKVQANYSSVALATVMKASDIPIPPGFVISSSSYHYFIEANDLRPVINDQLCTIRPDSPDHLASVATILQEHVHKARIPRAVTYEIEVAGEEMVKGGRTLTLYPDPRTGPQTLCLTAHQHRITDITPETLLTAWHGAVLEKYSSKAILERIRHGLADSETPAIATVFLLPTHTITGDLVTSQPFFDPNSPRQKRKNVLAIIPHAPEKTETAILLNRQPGHHIISAPESPCLTPHNAKKMADYGLRIENILGGPQQITWLLDTRNRLWITKILPAVSSFPSPHTGLERGIRFITPRTLPSPMTTTSFRPENSKSMYDLVCFAREMAIAEMFTLVNRSGLGLEGAKNFSQSSINLQILNLADGFFPTAAGLSTIGPNDLKSIPMWAVWFGLDSALKSDEDRIPQESQGETPPMMRGYVIISRTYLHMTMTIGLHYAEIDANCGLDDEKNHVFFRFRSGDSCAPRDILKKMTLILKKQNFTITIQGNMLEARTSGEEETVVQKKLAMLGKLLVENYRASAPELISLSSPRPSEQILRSEDS